MNLVIIHYHLRPGGIRRVIELAVPHLVREAPRPITRIVLATGEAADRAWHTQFARQVPTVPVELRVEPSFLYLSEQRGGPERIQTRVRRAVESLLTDCDGDPTVVWAHNLGVGRNLLLTRELAAACATRGLPLVAHHHDWWFDNRWSRWPEMRRFGIRTLAAAARTVFPPQGQVLHTAINQADAATLARHLGRRSLWLPNLTEPASLPSPAAVDEAERWLRRRLSPGAHPIWLLPCRALRRKNIAEALLLTRWLRPEAWLVVTGTASSTDELPYFQALERTAHRHHWRLRLGVLAGDEGRQPAIPALLAASEAVLLTSIQEGFGLPYLEAAAAQRPLIARRLPNIAPDLRRFGFRFPQAYDEILIAPQLFDWVAERARQRKAFRQWCATMPKVARAQVAPSALIESTRPRPMPFSRLTLAAQLEVLSQPVRETWRACAPLNPFLEPWRQRASAGKLRVTRWPRSAKQWLGGKAYARRLFTALASLPHQRSSALTAECVQCEFIAAKCDARNLYPLLWSKDS